METREAYAIPYPSILKRSGFRTTHYIASQGSCDTVRREEREPEPGRILGRGARIAVCATRHLHHILEENRDPLAGRPTGFLPYRVTGEGEPTVLGALGLLLLLLILSLTPAWDVVRYSPHPVTTAVLRTPELDEGAMFELYDDRWVEVASGDLPGTFKRFFRRLSEARSEWREGVLRVEGPSGAEVVLLVPDPEGFSVTEDSTFLEDGPLPEGACVLLGERVRVFRTRVPWEGRLPFETARESLVSVRWIEGTTYYEHSDWAAHDWKRHVSGGGTVA